MKEQHGVVGEHPDSDGELPDTDCEFPESDGLVYLFVVSGRILVTHFVHLNAQRYVPPVPSSVNTSVMKKFAIRFDEKEANFKLRKSQAVFWLHSHVSLQLGIWTRMDISL